MHYSSNVFNTSLNGEILPFPFLRNGWDVTILNVFKTILFEALHLAIPTGPKLFFIRSNRVRKQRVPSFFSFAHQACIVNKRTIDPWECGYEIIFYNAVENKNFYKLGVYWELSLHFEILLIRDDRLPFKLRHGKVDNCGICDGRTRHSNHLFWICREMFYWILFFVLVDAIYLTKVT